ncbi:putative SNF2 family helicase/ATPase [Aspergillus clavatus NRRL 1]|uniref:SNF2 family helicase/ATPase, putative n=1 Tax=Aspergillus clavatus (strain ATCC 1007 / CBS 513.65 / DSM 816 / NCTC 3887 / NRRL 1 / QM 1276 / 107) TaxID=344612 RepID=A1CA02_ASPCL|nr:SNF2 family helicase/ATPase, putative [Aspergillus clavatus NRRL 1]EAW12570.1 SNF2 family helicase/ATPase, putative [Aspergillus clavatus NRRL 1]
METDDGDPIDWTVNEVVAFLCHNPQTPWSQSTTQAPRPNPAQFEAALRENLITGEVLLHDVDKETLREELGLKAIGHRSSMLMAIRYLQRRSQKYQRSRADLTPQLGDRQYPFSPSLLASMIPGTQQEISSPVHRNFVLFTSEVDDIRRNLPAPNSPALPLQRKGSDSRAISSDVVENVDDSSQMPQSVPPDAGGTGPTTEKHVDHPQTSEGIRAQEHVFVDAQGKKRRKLDLSSLPRPQNDSLVLNPLNPLQDKEWYMGPERVLLSQLFYPPTTDEDDQSFIMLGPKFPTAQRHVVKKCLNYYYKQRPIELKSDEGGSQLAILPYDYSKANEADKHLFTLYTAKNGTVAVTQENIKKWPQLNQAGATDPKSPRTLNPSDPYSYLLQKYPAGEDDQDLCPVYGESGSEGEFDEETWQEITNEHDELTQHKPRRLTSTEVDAVIENCINEFVDKWRRNGLPKEETKAWKLWQMTRRAKCTNQSIKAITRDINLLERRLGKVLEAIRGSEYTSQAELQTQCQSMEQTVLDIQKRKWRISVLEQEKCPAKVAAPLKNRTLPQPKARFQDEESLHSESGMSSGSLDDFIDDSDLTGHAPSVGNIAGTIEEQNILVETNDRLLDEHGFMASVENSNRTQTPTPSTSESDDDIISPSGIRRKSRARRLPFMATSSPSPLAEHRGANHSEVIDLTMESPSADELRIETPPLNPVRPGRIASEELDLKLERTPSTSPGPPRGSQVVVEIPRWKADQSNPKLGEPRPAYKGNSKDLPDHYDFVALLSYPWVLLEERTDRRRLLAKLIASLPIEERENMTRQILTFELESLKKLVKRALKVLKKGEERIPDIDHAVSQLIMRTAALFISWVNCVHLSMQGISKKQIQKTRQEIDGIEEFHGELSKNLRLCEGLELRKQPSGNKPSTSSNQFGDSEDEQLSRPDAPHKKRKKKVEESQDAKRTQERAQRRVARQEQERKRLERKMESMGVSNTDPARQAVSFGEPIIYLDSHIGRRIKPHQLNGIQFLWRELIHDEKQQGCLLAHTMGLGKTMQVISLLTTISAAASSHDPSISQQVPTCFHRSQTLILCPSSLIENWYEEFLMWTPEGSSIGPLRKVTAASTVSERFREVSDWDEEGGILIMSYDIFRTWVLNAETSKRAKPLQDEEHVKVKEWLLEGPNIIVADEAHKMKNPSSGICRAAMQFRSKSRIALTGSPLANNLVDYYTMVNWIAEGYLGEFLDFKANYVEPIEDGLYVDSTYYERRKSLKKLQVLKEILDPKVNRADITVLEGSLPPKVEFVITIPLTPLQQSAYDSYVKSVVQGRRAEVGTAKLWSWMAILGLCCNHPACFREKLLSKANESQKSKAQMIPGDEAITQLDLSDSERLVSEQEELFAAVPDIKALNLSYRAQLLDRIVTESINAGDKVLIFSHRIPTLNYIEHILKAANRSYCRLDGKTPIFSRQASTKRFNTGSEEQVYLISTRAGGLGLNIPGANRVVIFDFSFSPVWEEQAVGRAYRLGQQKPVYVYRFISGGTFEEIMYNKAVFKTQLAFRVVDKKNPVRWASKKLNEYLFPAKPVKQHDVSEFLGKDKHVLDKILKEDNGDERAIRKINLTETFQKEDNDKLTEEERKDVQQELDDERLKRTDPQAYLRMLEERRQAERLAPPAPTYSQPQAQSWAAKPPMPFRYGAAQQARYPPFHGTLPSTAPAQPNSIVPFTPSNAYTPSNPGSTLPAHHGPVLPRSGSSPAAASTVVPNPALNDAQNVPHSQSEPPQQQATAASSPEYQPPNPPIRMESRSPSVISGSMQVDGSGSDSASPQESISACRSQ